MTRTANKFTSWLNRPLRYQTISPFFIVSLALFASAVIPLLVTIDGIIYIANAKSILTPDFESIYTLYREPGYPLFLKLIHFWGDAGVLVVFSQALLLSSAGLMAFFSIKRLTNNQQPRIWEIVLLWIFLINPMFLGYSGTILQQALFSFQLAVFALFLSWSIQRPSRMNSWMIFAITILWYITAIATSIGWIYLGLLPVSATIFMLLFPHITRFSKKQRKSLFIHIVLVGISIPLIIAFTYVVGRQTYQVWENYKLPYIQQQQTEGYVIEPLETLPTIPTPSYLAVRTLSLMNMTVMEPYEKENDLFMGIQMRRQTPSSSWDSAWEGEPQASYALNYFVITNPGELLHNGYARLASIAPLWYQGSFIVMWLLAMGFLISRRWKPLAILTLIPINFLLVYAASNSPIDRYGVPTYVFAVSSVVISVAIISKLLSQSRKTSTTGKQKD